MGGRRWGRGVAGWVGSSVGDRWMRGWVGGGVGGWGVQGWLGGRRVRDWVAGQQETTERVAELGYPWQWTPGEAPIPDPATWF